MRLPERVDPSAPTAAEFFAGIGLVRLGLEAAGFAVKWSNDIDDAKRRMYEGHFRPPQETSHRFLLEDIGSVSAETLPPGLSLAWASSPCTDLSLAGGRRGLGGSESGTFWHFVRILDEMGSERPPVIVLENVVGLATSHGGEDLAAAIGAFNSLGYSADVLSLDARRFVPQSRPRLFIVGAQNAPSDSASHSSELRPDWLQGPYGDPTLTTHQAVLPNPPSPLTSGLTAIVDRLSARDDRWWDSARTQAFLASLSPLQAERLKALRAAKIVAYRTAYRRTRNGSAVWEVRQDDISGCLRTARGGSSKQAVVKVGRGQVQVRWMTPREYARLMGAPEYRLHSIRESQALFGFGDAVCVPAVEWLARNYLLPLVRGDMNAKPQLVLTGA